MRRGVPSSGLGLKPGGFFGYAHSGGPSAPNATPTASTLARTSLTTRHALRVDVERVHRGARRHEQAVAVEAAEADVGAALRQVDAADQLRLAVEDVDAVERVRAHAPAHPEVAVDVGAKAVGRPAGPGLQEDASLGELGAVVDQVVDLDDPR